MLKVLSYWNLNFFGSNLDENLKFLKVLSYWNLNTLLEFSEGRTRFT